MDQGPAATHARAGPSKLNERFGWFETSCGVAIGYAFSMTNVDHLAALLLERGAFLAVAESLTGGRLQAALTAKSGASHFFAGGLTAYTLEQKVALLGVDRVEAQAVNCVSAAVAHQMVTGVAERFGVSVAAATTGYAEPWGDVDVAQAHFATLVDGVVVCEWLAVPGCTRLQVQQRVVDAVLDALVKRL